LLSNTFICLMDSSIIDIISTPQENDTFTFFIIYENVHFFQKTPISYPPLQMEKV
jgi:hypothetical protein